LKQLQRQAALLADWPGEPLDQLLGRTAKLNEEEWQAVVGKYVGKAIVFHAEVRRDASRQYHAKLFGAKTLTLRLELQPLTLLNYLPLEAPEAILFGARLAEVRRTGPDTFAIRVQPASGVLLTDTPTIGSH
jgi:hypothetical protein